MFEGENLLNFVIYTKREKRLTPSIKNMFYLKTYMLSSSFDFSDIYLTAVL